MAIPQIVFVACPGCGTALELSTLGWQVALTQKEADEDGPGGHGVFLELAAFGGHVCWSDEA